jgi:hypothetical protein
MVYTPVAASNVAVPGGVTPPTSDWFSNIPNELLAVCGVAMLDAKKPSANADNASNPVPLFPRYTMNLPSGQNDSRSCKLEFLNRAITPTVN